MIDRGYFDDVLDITAQSRSAWQRDAFQKVLRDVYRFVSWDCYLNGNFNRGIYKNYSLRGSNANREEIWAHQYGSTGFVLGKTHFIRGYDMNLHLNCCSGDWCISGYFYYSINDRFERPLDVPLEVFGKPYRLSANWRVPFRICSNTWDNPDADMLYGYDYSLDISRYLGDIERTSP